MRVRSILFGVWVAAASLALVGLGVAEDQLALMLAHVSGLLAIFLGTGLWTKVQLGYRLADNPSLEGDRGDALRSVNFARFWVVVSGIAGFTMGAISLAYAPGRPTTFALGLCAISALGALAGMVLLNPLSRALRSA